MQNTRKRIAALLVLLLAAGIAAPLSHAQTQDSPMRFTESAEVVLTDANVTAADSPALSVENGATVTLVLQGTNHLQGGTGYAGIYVAPGSTLIISAASTGTLHAQGGAGANNAKAHCGGGAGIGGNGRWLKNKPSPAADGSYPTNQFGTIRIEGGEVTAVGGTAGTASSGGGAGIGGGGASCEAHYLPSNFEPASGSIVITGGVVTATGGKGTAASIYLIGGAGIGSGGLGGSPSPAESSHITIEISGGVVKAVGKSDGAGIGGGANCQSGTITISGGTVDAQGGYEMNSKDEWDGSYFGGAGIGGGDNGFATKIDISGNAVVTSHGGGGAAGIGGGGDGYVGTHMDSNGIIHIRGNANVTAYAGPHKSYSGAAIGAGLSAYFQNCSGTIHVEDNAVVTAYGGIGAQTLGVGARYNGLESDNRLVVGDNCQLYLFNADTAKTPFTGLAADGGSVGETAALSEKNRVVWSTAAANSGTATAMVGGVLDTVNYTFDFDGSDLKIYEKGSLVKTVPFIHPMTPTLSSWAVVLGPLPAVTVTPADMSVYMGGEQGYQAGVDGSAESVTGGSMPHPLFHITGVQDANGMLFEDSSAGTGTPRTWKAVASGGGLYYILDTQTEKHLAVQFHNGESYVNSDRFDPQTAGALHTSFRIELIAPQQEGVLTNVTAAAETGNRYVVNAGTGTLRVRYVVSGDSAFAALSETLPAEKLPAGSAAATANAGTKFTLNNSGVAVGKDAKISLLFDELYAADGQDRLTALLNHAKAQNKLPEIAGKLGSQGRYLDLVDVRNGNSWVTASENITVTWAYPAGTDSSTTFTLLHFAGLHREGESCGYDIGDIAQSTVQTVAVSNTEAGIQFQVGSGGFSPFVLVWDQPNDVTLTYDSQGGTVFDKEVYPSGTQVKLDKTPQRTGFTFTGWYTAVPTAGSTPITEIKLETDTKVYAGWQQQSSPLPPPATTPNTDASGSLGLWSALMLLGGVGIVGCVLALWRGKKRGDASREAKG